MTHCVAFPSAVKVVLLSFQYSSRCSTVGAGSLNGIFDGAHADICKLRKSTRQVKDKGS